MVIESDVESAVGNYAGKRSVSFIDEIKTGVNELYHFGLEHGDEKDDEYVIKFATFTPRRRFRSEPVLQQELSENNIRVPNVRYISTSSFEDVPHPYFIMDFVTGSSVEEQFDTSGLFPKSFYSNLGEKLGQIHSCMTFDSTGNFSVNDKNELITESEAWPNFMRSQTNTLLNRAERGPFSHYCSEFREYFMFALGLLPMEVSNPVVIHNDYRVENILLHDDGKIKSVLDWGNTFSGHDEYNIIRTLYFLTRQFANTGESFDEIYQAFLDGYEKHRSIRSRSKFEERKNVYYGIALVSEMAGFDVWWDGVSDEQRVIEKNRVENSIQSFFD